METQATQPTHVFPAASNQAAQVKLAAILLGLTVGTAVCLYFAWLSYRRMEGPIRFFSAAASGGPVLFLVYAFTQVGPIRYVITGDKLAVFSGRAMKFYVNLDEIAGVETIEHEAFFNSDLRLGGRNKLFRPYFFNDASVLGHFEHARLGPAIVLVNRSAQYCLIRAKMEGLPLLLVSPEDGAGFTECLRTALTA